jgi:membrane-associated phospholipid phosphatase
VNTSISNLIRNRKHYFSLVMIFFLSSFFALLVFGKTVCSFPLEAYHSFWLNVFFINFTFIGDGIFVLCLIALVYFYFKNKKLAFTLLYSFLVSGIAVQIIKNLAGASTPRLFFEAGQYLNFLNAVTPANNASFPSGHTATVFAIATVLVLMLKNKNWQIPIFFVAVLVGYTRIYLAQHFLIDVIIGAFIGTVSGVLSYHLVIHAKGIKSYFKKSYNSNSIKHVPPSLLHPA